MTIRTGDGCGDDPLDRVSVATVRVFDDRRGTVRYRLTRTPYALGAERVSSTLASQKELREAIDVWVTRIVTGR
ncbi:hypothetical protein BTZ20_0519 [Rhodococcus sp. MTM3W5.2]|nr:hypothetical protein BTZ20_0519 [Rhodococcus sp. MTM3W5.2]